MGTKTWTVIVIIALLAAGALFAFYDAMPKEFECDPRDGACMTAVESNVDNCVPSVSIIRGDNVTLMVNITREGQRCIITEAVIESRDSGMNLTGFENTCEIPASEIGGNDLISKCPGSVYDLVAEDAGTAGAGGAEGSSPGEDSGPGIIYLDCEKGDTDCKQQIHQNILNCVTCQAKDIELKWEPTGYWTRAVSVENQGTQCHLHVEILNAVDIPPGEPADIIGMDMDCYIPADELPVSDLTSEQCEGRLFDYLNTL